MVAPHGHTGTGLRKGWTASHMQRVQLFYLFRHGAILQTPHGGRQLSVNVAKRSIVRFCEVVFRRWSGAVDTVSAGWAYPTGKCLRDRRQAASKGFDRVM